MSKLGGMGAGMQSEDESFLLHEADTTQVHPVGNGCFSGSWLADNSKDVTYALARMPVLYLIVWLVLLLVIGPEYFPEKVRTIIFLYFGYALPRFFVILSAGFVACIKCIKRNNEADSRSLITEVPKDSPIAFTDVKHVVICCIYTEPIEKIAETLETLEVQMEVSKQMYICVATEARDKNGIRTAKELRRRFGHNFGGFYITQHTIAAGEVAGKSSNENWAARCMKHRLVDELKNDINHIVITCCDADTFFHRQHFAELTCRFCTDNARYESFWQTPVVHYGNLFELPLLCQARYAMISVAHLGISNAPWFRGLPFSTYALSMNLAVKAGYWDPHIISEDYHMYLKCFFCTGGQVSMKYMWLPVACDVPITADSLSTIKACYDQHVRWMYGSMDIGFFFVRCGLTVPGCASVPMWRKIYLFLTMWEFHLLYPAMWLVILILFYTGGIDISQYYLYAPPIWFVMGMIMLTDFLIREMGMKGRLHVHSSLQDHGFCFRIRWPFIVFGCLLTIADIIFQTTATYHSQFKSAWNPVLEYKVAPKMVKNVAKDVVYIMFAWHRFASAFPQGGEMIKLPRLIFVRKSSLVAYSLCDNVSIVSLELPAAELRMRLRSSENPFESFALDLTMDALQLFDRKQRDGCVFPRILGPIEDDHDSALGDAALSEHSSNWKEESDTAATLPAADASSSDTTLSDLTDSSDEEFDSAEEEAERSTKTDLFTFSLLPFGNKIAIYGANLVLAPLKR